MGIIRGQVGNCRGAGLRKEYEVFLMYTERIEVRGHIIDSMILPQILDAIMDIGVNFEFEEFEVGRTKDEPSWTSLTIISPTQELLDQALEEIERLGATLVEAKDARVEPAPANGVFPPSFYSSTNLRTEVRCNGQWIAVDKTEMDCAIVLDCDRGQAECVPIIEVKKGDPVVVGHSGIRVERLQRARQREKFSFMVSQVSSEKPKEPVLADIAEEMREIKRRGGKIVVVGGPAIIHTGGGPYLAKLIDAGYVNVVFAGNALATHDVESVLFGTSLGTCLKTGISAEGGHCHHLRAINAIRAAGSLSQAVEKGVLTDGLMYACVKNNVDFVLAGSIRDDGPLPDVVTDTMVAQTLMREKLQGAELVLMIATTLHSIAVGNLLPAWVRTVCVDSNPSVITKLTDRGSWQALGLIMDAQSFLRELCLRLL
jgi:lysine-ketoglutarate reductase/saccharopine dehydrogenase-like protein (TIGR00300 family)